MQTLPPAAWVSAVAADVTSVDVDSMSAYYHLLQESIVLQPSLLMQPPRQVAASLVVLERSLRLSVVWLGPIVVSHLLATHNPISLASHLSDLLEVWLSFGQAPHSFGQLWLDAPSALLGWDGPSFEHHLVELQHQMPQMPIGRLLASSSSLAGMLLSLPDASQLSGCVLEHGGYLIIAPHFCNISVREEVATPRSINAFVQENERHNVLIYNVFGYTKDSTHKAHVGRSPHGCDDEQPILLMQLDGMSPRDKGLMPMAVLPPRP
jgi:hypothetical protein